MCKDYVQATLQSCYTTFNLGIKASIPSLTCSKVVGLECLQTNHTASCRHFNYSQGQNKNTKHKL